MDERAVSTKEQEIEEMGIYIIFFAANAPDPN